MRNKVLLGAHLSYKKESQLLGTIEDAITIGANSGAFYISNSRSYSKFEQNLDNIEKATKLAEENNIKLENFIVHSPLIGNLANVETDNDIYERTFESYLQDLKMLERAGIKLYNFHPGSSPQKEKAYKQIGDAINKLHNLTQGDSTVLLLETMMAKGNYIGKTFNELAEILKYVDNKERVGVCLDTCHVWDAGYDIKNNLDKTLDEFDNVVGLKYLKALHINDSKNILGSNKDRHELIGQGHIGLDALKKLVNHPKLINLPKALETPYGKEDFKKWALEIEMLTN